MESTVPSPWQRRPSAVRAMTLMCLASCLLASAAVLLPVTDRSPSGWTAASAVLAAVLAAGVWLSQARSALHLGVLCHVLGIAGLVSQSVTGAGAAGAMLCNVWVALYSAFFLGQRSARIYSGLTGAALAAALVDAPFLGATHLWATVTATTVLSTEVVGRVVDRLAAAALTDPLTGALNRAGLADAARLALGSAGRTGCPLSVAVLDLDGFKSVNDQLGHAAGDRLLVDAVRTWRSALRAGDVLARQGGDEFVLLLPDTDAEGAERLLGRLRGLSTARWSAGAATAGPGDSLDSLLARADRRLYQAKAVRTKGDPTVPRQRRATDLRSVDA